MDHQRVFRSGQHQRSVSACHQRDLPLAGRSQPVAPGMLVEGQALELEATRGLLITHLVLKMAAMGT